MDKTLITPDEAAEILHIAPDTVRLWCRTEPAFPSIKVGDHYKIDQSELRTWIENQWEIKIESSKRD